MQSIKKLLSYTKPLKLLYVEDSKSVREMFSLIFEPLFDEVILAENGEIGLELFKKHNIDIIITDIEMPIMNGLEMSKNIRAIDDSIPIILATGHVESSFFLESIEIGVDGYLPKPIEQELLKRTLERVCKTIAARKNLKEESEYFKILTEASIVSKSNLEGTITYANDNFCNISGYTREEMIGRSHNIFRHPDNDDNLYTNLWQTILAGNVWRGRVKNIKKDNTTFLCDTIIIPLTNSKGKIEEFIAIRQDVTEYVELQKKLSDEKYKKEEQERVHEAKEAFLILFTHELKTPLNAIINFAKYLKGKVEKSEHVEESKMKTLLGSILKNGTEMLSNVNNILEISKLKSGKLIYTNKLFNLKDTINEIVEQFDSLSAEKAVAVEIQIPDDIFIHSDEFRVRQIFSNIYSNAIKYGNNKILIKSVKNDTGVELSFHDNGKGIEDKESIFNLYERAEESILNHSGKGTGVGLYFFKLLCEDLKIPYFVKDSAPLGGTEFMLKFNEDRKK